MVNLVFNRWVYRRHFETNGVRLCIDIDRLFHRSPNIGGQRPCSALLIRRRLTQKKVNRVLVLVILHSFLIDPFADFVDFWLERQVLVYLHLGAHLLGAGHFDSVSGHSEREKVACQIVQAVK